MKEAVSHICRKEISNLSKLKEIERLYQKEYPEPHEKEFKIKKILKYLLKVEIDACAHAEGKI